MSTAERAAEAIRKALAEIDCPLQKVIIQHDERADEQADKTEAREHTAEQTVCERHVCFCDKARASLEEAKELITLFQGADAIEVMTTVVAAIKALPEGAVLQPSVTPNTNDPLSVNWFLDNGQTSYLGIIRKNHKSPLYDAINRLEAIAVFSDQFPELEKLNDSARTMLRAAMYIEAHAEPAKFGEIEDCLDTSTTTNKKSRKALVESNLLIQEGKGQTTRWRVTNRGVELANHLRKTLWVTFKVP